MSRYYRRLREKIGSDLIFNPAVVAVIRDAEGRVLFVQEVGSAAWGLPAGAIEMGETPAQAVIREVFEETGLQVVEEAVLGVFGGEAFRWQYPDGNQVEYLAIVFSCRVVGGSLRPVDGETQAFRYFASDDLPPLPLPYPSELLTRRPGEAALYQSHA